MRFGHSVLAKIPWRKTHQLEVNKIERFDRVFAVDDAGDVDLAAALRDDLYPSLGSIDTVQAMERTSMLIEPSASTLSECELAQGKVRRTHVNILPAMPTMLCICLPTRDRIAISCLNDTSPSALRSPITRSNSPFRKTPCIAIET